MTLDAFACFRELDLVPADNEVLADWDASHGLTWPLADEELRETCEYCGFSEDLTDAVIQQWQAIVQDPQLERIALHAWYCLQQQQHPTYFFPHDHTAFSPLINVPLFLQALPALRQQYKARGIPGACCRETIADLLLWIEDYKSVHGTYGLMQVHWLKHHVRFELIKLGRLQFESVQCNAPIVVFRRDDELRLACVAGAVIAQDGLFASANTNAAPGFETTWHEDDTSWKVHCFDPEFGLVEAEPRHLLKSEWSICIQQGDDLLSVHIPATGPMTIAACAESFARAPDFFAKYFPELSLKGFYCSSWLLSPYFANYLKPDANLVLFMQSWHKFAKSETTGREFFYRVWGHNEIDIETAAQETSLQRAVISHIKSGGVWNDMGGIRLIDDLPFGPYC